MSFPRPMRRTAYLFVGVVAMLVLAELTLRLLPTLGGVYAADAEPAWPVRTAVPHLHYTYSHGWDLRNIHHGQINNFGYAAPFDYLPGSSGLVVIGNSYVESEMNDYADTLQGQLGRLLLYPRTVMAFGTSGADLPHYLGVAQLIHRYFTPQWAIVVIVEGDYVNGFKAMPGFYRWEPDGMPPIALIREGARSRLDKLVRSLAIVRYLRGDLAFTWSNLIRLHRAGMAADLAARGQAGASAAAAPTCTPEKLSDLDRRLTARAIQAFPVALGLPDSRIILVFDSDRRAIYEGRVPDAPCTDRDTLARKRLMNLAVESGMHVIDSYSVFRSYYRSTHLPLDYLPADMHWNGAAHRLMAQQVAGIINAVERGPTSEHTAAVIKPPLAEKLKPRLE